MFYHRKSSGAAIRSFRKKIKRDNFKKGILAEERLNTHNASVMKINTHILTG